MKKVTKIICLIIAAILIVAAIIVLSTHNGITYKLRTSPDDIEDKTGKLTDNMKSEIQLEYFRDRRMLLSPKKVEGVCYGVFDDAYCVILRSPGSMATVMTYEEVAGCKFEYGREGMRVYSNRKFYSLTEAYANGILNDAEIEELWDLYTDVLWGRPGDDCEIKPCPWDYQSLQLNEDIKREIQIARLIDIHGEYYEKMGYVPEHVWVVCYGIFDNVYGVMTWGPGVGYVKEEKTVTVGEYTFRFDDSNTMMIYYDGEFYSMNQAYQMNLLDDLKLKELYDYYNEAHYGIKPE